MLTARPHGSLAEARTGTNYAVCSGLNKNFFSTTTRWWKKPACEAIDSVCLHRILGIPLGAKASKFTTDDPFGKLLQDEQVHCHVT